MAENTSRTKKSTSTRKRKTSSSAKGASSKKNKKKRFGDTIYDEVLLLVIMIVSCLVFFSLCTSKLGVVGSFINSLFKGLFGGGSFLLPAAVVGFCVWIIIKKDHSYAWIKIVGIVLAIVGLAAMLQIIFDGERLDLTEGKFTQMVAEFYKNGTGLNGGLFGGLLAFGLKNSIGWGSYIVIFAVFVIGVMLSTGKSLFTGIEGIVNAAGEHKHVREAKIKAKAENIRHREQRRERESEYKEYEFEDDFNIQRSAKKAKTFNFPINESSEIKEVVYESKDFEPEKQEKQEKQVEEKEKPIYKPFGLGIKEKTHKLIEVLGLAEDVAEEPIAVLKMYNENSDENLEPTAEDDDFEEPIIPIIKVAGENIDDIVIEDVSETEETNDYSNEMTEVDIQSENILSENETNKTYDETDSFEKNENIEENTEKTPINLVKEKTAVSGEENSDDIEQKTDEKAEELNEETENELSSESTDDMEEDEFEEEYKFPPIDILGKRPQQSSGDTKNDMIANAKKLEETLGSFGVEARVVQINKGPTVTRYELTPKQGVKVSKIVNLADDIALNLAATGIRIEAPIPGKAAVGIEVPNREPQSVYLRSVLESENFKNFSSKLAFALGEDIAGNAIVTDIAKMPHLLIAGATGSGKSVCINTLITSILYKASPQEVKLLLIDPKVVELSIYNGIPHLMIPVVTDPKKAASALNWAVREMLNRYQCFADHNVRDISGYNRMKVDKDETDLMPQIVIIIDELADLMMAAAGDVEDAICRLAQMARAAGMHLIIATQRPSVDVITGVIKANIPSRLAFAVSSGIDSRTILDSVGAEKLLGKGDMLFYPVGMSKPVRIQGAFVTDKEVEKIVESIKKGRKTKYNQEMIDAITSVGKSDDKSQPNDEHYDEACDLVVEKQKASVSMLQRQFRIGYNRAARLMDELEQRGIVGPEEGSKPRKVLITMSQLNDMRYPSNDDES